MGVNIATRTASIAARRRGKPAARIGDQHVCPSITGVVPHVGGPLLKGSPNVTVVAQPAVRLADLATCVGPLDAVAVGSSGVLINNLLAARVGDGTIHGGKLTQGAGTVLIGNAKGNVTLIKRGLMYVIVDRDHHRITIVGVQEFSGTGASADYASRVTGIVNNTWSGPTTFEGHPYVVSALVTGRFVDSPSSKSPMANQVNVVHTTQTQQWNDQHDPAHQKGPLGGGYQHSNEDLDGQVGTAHEFGHAMGIKDEYREGPRNPDGTRNIIVDAPPGGLMGHVHAGARPTPANFNSLITGDGLDENAKK